MSRRLRELADRHGPGAAGASELGERADRVGGLGRDREHRPSSCHHHRPMRALSRFGPPLALMGVIFFFSAQPDLGTGPRRVGHDPAQGRAHGRVRAAVVPLAPGARSCAARCPRWRSRSPMRRATSSTRRFVEGRHGTPVDVLIDAAGVGDRRVLSMRAGGTRTGIVARAGTSCSPMRVLISTRPRGRPLRPPDSLRPRPAARQRRGPRHRRRLRRADDRRRRPRPPPDPRSARRGARPDLRAGAHAGRPTTPTRSWPATSSSASTRAPPIRTCAPRSTAWQPDVMLYDISDFAAGLAAEAAGAAGGQRQHHPGHPHAAPRRDDRRGARRGARGDRARSRPAARAARRDAVLQPDPQGARGPRDRGPRPDPALPRRGAARAAPAAGLVAQRRLAAGLPHLRLGRAHDGLLTPASTAPRSTRCRCCRCACS